MYSSLDRVDVAGSSPTGRPIAVLTDHRGDAELAAEPDLGVLLALARVLAARRELRARPGSCVHYVLLAATAVPGWLADGLALSGAVIHHGVDPLRPDPAAFDAAPGEYDAVAVGEQLDAAFGRFAAHTLARLGTADPALALRMLEDQSAAVPVVRHADDREIEYWRRVLELAALTGEVLRAQHGGRWVETDRAQVPFAFQLESPQTGVAELFPTNRAQRVLEGGESLFSLIDAAAETRRAPPDAEHGRVMPSLRAREDILLDEVHWRELPAGVPLPADAPIVVCGIDGELIFAITLRSADEEPAPAAMFEQALANLAQEPVTTQPVARSGARILEVVGSHYAAEKLLDRAFLQQLQRELGAAALAVAAPTRGELLVAPAEDELALAGLAAQRYAAAAEAERITRCVLHVRAGEIVGPSPGPGNDDDDAPPASPETAGRPGLLRRLFKRT